MTSQSRLGLRQVARQLARTTRFNGSFGEGARGLLNLLQDGEVSSFFYFPSAHSPALTIPKAYWREVGVQKFRRVLANDEIRRGRFLVKPTDFIEQYASWFASDFLSQEPSEPGRARTSSELSMAMEKMDQRQEAYVDEQEWSRYMESAQLTVIEAKQRPSGGRSPMAAMPDILVELAASMLAQERLHPGLTPEYIELASTAVAKVEQKLGRGIKVPQSDYIAKKASEICTLRDEMLVEAGLPPDRVGAADEPKSGR